ncbi:hypothetical protein [Symbiobacterium thermophilum]|uniref:Uncharacterized protein n=1 Tax=Symbiobacterium thermophilum TaxID=2734 RepID=A0A953I2I2_SYMTR|nr:hypothetical protein [Symbiobacterium thermophilum]MBY6277187.1 hypothetical protein [Symbiobacterium thermophilum]
MPLRRARGRGFAPAHRLQDAAQVAEQEQKPHRVADPPQDQRALSAAEAHPAEDAGVVLPGAGGI